MLEFKKINTPVGTMVLVANESSLVYFVWERYFNQIKAKLSDLKVSKSNKIIIKAEKQLEKYFDGKLKKFNLPLSPHGTEFQRAAWNELKKINYGGKISYGEQAKRIGNPKAVRAIGGANGKNPIAIIVPCHRVIGANGTLTGFGGGMRAKRYLLKHEESFT